MPAISPNPDPVLSPPAPATAGVSQRGLMATLLEYFLRLVVVALGIVIGFIVAAIIGLVTGWIRIGC